MANKITRSTVNDQQYSAPEIATSGFPLSYRRYTNFMLGRIHVGGFHWVMPGDKISGKTSTSANGLTFKRMVTPIISPVNAMQYNIFLPLRPLDRSFKKGSTPTKDNAMSANWSMPLCNTRYLFEQILRAYLNITPSDDIVNDSTTGSRFDALLREFVPGGSQTISSVLADAITSGNIPAGTTVDALLYDANGIVAKCVNSLITTGTIFANMADNLYLRDALIDIAANITAKLGNSDNPLSGSTLFDDFLNDWLSALFTPFIGRYSYYAEFKYNFVRPFDFYRISRGQVVQLGSISGLIDSFDNTPQNEYPLRAIYAVWYELFRNVDLEPVNSNLPDWQEWSSTSIFDMSSGGNLLYLIYRIRSWEKDMFISAQIDDLSRHVYAPIVTVSDSSASYHSRDFNNNDTQSTDDAAPDFPAGMRKPAVLKLGYHDQLSDSDVDVQCPIPTNVNDVLSSTDLSLVDIYGLDLNSLRQSQMLEKYLKRNYLFGDEYQDRILAHYNSRVSDMRINKPEILSQSLDGYDMKQQVSNVSTSAGTNVGDRTATATVPVNGNPYTTYCEEFGILMSIVCIMPRAMYDGICPQLLMAKQIDMPIPEFATNNEEFGRKVEISGSGLAPLADGSDNRFMFGRYPAYHAWRSRVDEVGGEFLDELQDSTFRRFFGMFSDDTTPKLNYFFIHCRPNLQMFADPIMYDTQLYGDLVHECFVERVLPTPVEVI